MKNTSTQANDYPLLQKIAKPKMEVLLKLYADYQKVFTIVRFAIFGIIAIIFIYNIAFAGKKYSTDEYRMITNVIVLIMSIMVLLLISLGVYGYKKQQKVKAELKKLAANHHTEYKPLKKEFNTFVKIVLRGMKV